MRSSRAAGRWLTLLVIIAAAGVAACRAPRVEPPRDRRAGGISDPGTGAAVGRAAHAGASAAGPAAAAPGAPAPVVAPAANVETPADGRPVVLFLGDSLTAGRGLALEDAFPTRVEALLTAQGLPIRAVNAGVSGDTTAGGLERVGALLERRPAIVVVELGANDGLRGQPVDGIAANLREIVRRARSAGAVVVIAGMRIPPNYGPEYAEAFAALYPELARETGAELIPFLLEGVAGLPELNQADGIHPTAEGQSRVASTVATELAPLVRRLGARRGR